MPQIKVRMDSHIFSDPLFIRRNTLLNYLYSKFPTSDFSGTVSISNHTDLLRAIYHDLSLTKSRTERRHALSSVFNVLTDKHEDCKDIDWMYLERILIHFVNLEKPVPQHDLYLLNRKTSCHEYKCPSNPQ